MDGVFDGEVFVVGMFNEFGVDFFEGLNFVGGEGDVDVVVFGSFVDVFVFFLV